MVVMVVVGPPPASSRPVTGPRPQQPLSGLLPSRPRPPPQGSAPMAPAPQFRAGDRASRGERLGGVPCPAAARAPAASCFPPAALPSPPPALCAPAPTEPPSRAPPLGVAAAAAAAASPAAENEAASRSPGPALGHLIRRAGAPARLDGELRLRGPRPPCLATAAATQNPAPAPTWPGRPTAPVPGSGVLSPDRVGSRFYAQPHFALRPSPSSPQKLLFSATSLKKFSRCPGAGWGRVRASIEFRLRVGWWLQAIFPPTA